MRVERRTELSLFGKAAILLAVSVSSLSGTCFKPYIDRELSGSTKLTPEWLELTTKEPLKVDRDTQEVTLFPDPPIKTDFKDGDVIYVDGRKADIEAELVGSNAVTYRSSPGVSEKMTGNLYIIERSLDFKDLPRDITYKTVRIKSSVPYPVRKILWRCYNWADVHQ